MTWKFEAKTYFYTLKISQMNQVSPFNFSVHQLRETKYVGWFHATGIFRINGDKADFHAIGAI